MLAFTPDIELKNKGIQNNDGILIILKTNNGTLIILKNKNWLREHSRLRIRMESWSVIIMDFTRGVLKLDLHNSYKMRTFCAQRCTVSFAQLVHILHSGLV